MSEQLPPVTEADVQGLATQQSFNRGVGYYNSGAIFEPVRQGNDLRAYCEGSSYEPYRITATLGAQGIVSTYCTCPYDWGGICKHIVALLLTWVHEPDAFYAVPPLDEALAARSKEELVALIKEMLKRAPDLVRLLELPVQPDRQTPLDLEAFRKQIDFALRHDYPDAEGVATELSAIVDTADRFLAGDDWENAGALYHLVLEKIVPIYENLFDEGGDVSIELQHCAEGLDHCFFEGSPDVETRQAWLEALLEAYLTDLRMGGIDLASPAGELVIDHATDEEWAWVEQRARDVIATLEERFGRWRREALVGFLARRRELTGREDEIDDLIFELGSPTQQAFRLAHLGRFDKAVEIARQNFSELPGLVTRFADALVEAGAGSTAVAYVTGLLETRSRRSYLSWLAEHAEKQEDPQTALDWWRTRFQESPDLKTYKSLQKAAQQLDLWTALRPELLQTLEAEEKWGMLIEIALHEGQVLRAAELLPRLSGGWHAGRYDLDVAQAAEAEHPRIAIGLYQQQVERLIAVRGRKNYRTAAGLLTRVRELYRRQNSPDEWERYVADLRERHSHLPALQDELNQAGL